MTEKTQTTDLYRHYDKDGVLLYVGISLSTVNRLSQHKTFSHWYDEIEEVKIEKFTTRKDALEAERKAILNENPIHNKRLKASKKNISEHTNSGTTIVSRKNDAAEAITYKIVALNPIYTIHEAAIFLKISEIVLRQKIEKKEIGAMLLSESIKKTINGQNKEVRRYQISGWQLLEYIEYLEKKGAHK